MKRILTVAATLLLVALFSAPAQNVQLHYDFGKLLYKSGDKDLSTAPAVRPSLTSTVEMFRPDDWGSTYFFVDMN